jgi:hypothetical protein
MSKKMSTAQIGQCGVLLVRYKLLLHGIESAPMTTDTGIDLVASSSKGENIRTIQVKSRLRLAGSRKTLMWSIKFGSPADLAALVDINEDKVWLMWMKEFHDLAQQKSRKINASLYFHRNPKTKTKGRSLEHQYEEYLLENIVHKFF